MDDLTDKIDKLQVDDTDSSPMVISLDESSELNEVSDSLPEIESMQLSKELNIDFMQAEYERIRMYAKMYAQDRPELKVWFKSFKPAFATTRKSANKDKLNELYKELLREKKR